MDFPIRNRSKPLENHSFFLDTKNPPQLNIQLTEKITRLGGRIDFLLTKKTSCVVTNRPKSEYNNSASNYDCNNLETDSPTSKLIFSSNNTFSRGKLLLEKTTQKFKGIDTLCLAKKLNVRIIRSTKLMQFFDICIEKENKLKSLQINQIASNGGIIKLNPPFIKVVDNSFKYKPNHKELIEWPEINFEYQPELCPFFKPKPNVANQSLQSNKSTTTTNHKQLNERCTRLTTPILTVNNGNNAKIVAKRRHLTYCEICHKDFTDFESHLNEEKHAKFMNNEENFTEIVSVIKSLAPFVKRPVIIQTRTNANITATAGTILNDFKSSLPNLDDQKTIINHKNHHQQQPQQTILSSKTPPPMRPLHSINAWSSASKNGNFVPIHAMYDNEMDF